MSKVFRLPVICLMLIVSIICFGCESSSKSDDASYNGNPSGNEQPTDPLVVKTDCGLIRGKGASYSSRQWLGVPFAKPPVGELRWRAPQDPEPWEGMRDAIKYCSFCTQYGNYLSETGPDTLSDIIGDGKATGSEDCLYLNIWRPATDEKDLPVYVFIHGGGNIIGRSDVSIYDGARAASEGNYIFVTINYRLGYMGWFRHKALFTGDKLHDSGNFGTLDTIQALKWIQKNISAFGGDAGNVTVSGQSAGGINTLALMTANQDLTEGLFHKVIIHSGFSNSCPVESAEKKSQLMLERLVIQDGFANRLTVKLFLKNKTDAWIAEYLRSKTIEEIYPPDNCGPFTLPMDSISAVDAMMGVYEDGYVIPKAQIESIEEGSYKKVPVIIGCTKEELRLLISQVVFNPKRLWAATQSFDPDSSDFDISKLLDPIGYPVLALYGPLSVLGQSFMEGFGVDQTVMALKKWQDDVWVYKFMWDEEPEPFDFFIGAGHAMDLPFVFGTFIRDKSSLAFFAWNEKNLPGAEVLSSAMRKYYANFAHTGNPNAEGLEEWTVWSDETDGPKRLLFNLRQDENLDVQVADIEMSEQMIEPEQIPNPMETLESIIKILFGAAGV